MFPASLMKCNRKGVNALNITEKYFSALSHFPPHSIASSSNRCILQTTRQECCLSGAGVYYSLNLDSERRHRHSYPGTGSSMVSSLQPTVFVRHKSRHGLSAKDLFFKGLNLAK